MVRNGRKQAAASQPAGQAFYFFVTSSLSLSSSLVFVTCRWFLNDSLLQFVLFKRISLRTYVIMKRRETKELGIVSTKSMVLWICAALSIYRADAFTIVGIVGGAFSSVLSKKLKLIFNSPRPKHAFDRREPGMPSSHAQNLLFLSVYFTVDNGLSMKLSVISTAVVLALIRIRSGDHTFPQVFVGAFIGFVLAMIFHTIVCPILVPPIQQLLDRVPKVLIRIVFVPSTVILIRLFHVINKRWKDSLSVVRADTFSTRTSVR